MSGREIVAEKLALLLELGGRGSNINDRRNWDSYLVDGEVRQLSYIEARKMQGFPDDFEFPVSSTQAIKQLGNSVAVDAVQATGKNITSYMSSLTSNPVIMKKTKNKGEWSELLAFVTILVEQKILLADKNLNPTENYFNVTKVTGKNIDLDFLLTSQAQIEVVNKNTGEINKVDISKLTADNILGNLVSQIKANTKTFSLPDFEIIQNSLGLTVVKGGNSSQKADIILDIENDAIRKINEGFGIKSFLGSPPTLFNAFKKH